ncbi:hypothetical protein FKM82_018091 [Ascaphus truei]
MLEGLYFVDLCLPMGCALSCFYFETFSTFLEWVIRNRVQAAGIIHYLDDFLFVGPQGSDLCARWLFHFQPWRANLGFLWRMKKQWHPRPLSVFWA